MTKQNLHFATVLILTGGGLVKISRNGMPKIMCIIYAVRALKIGTPKAKRELVTSIGTSIIYCIFVYSTRQNTT